MTRTLALAAWFILAAPLYAQKLEIPAEIPAQPGQWLVVSPTTDCVAVTYVGLDGLAAFPSSELKDPKKLVVNPFLPGRYRFTAVGSLHDVHVTTPFTIVVAGPVPPTPPAPVPPGPTPPGPTDPLWLTLQAAYGADLGITKSTQARMLADVYRKASLTTVNNAALTTLGMLHDAVGGAAQVIVPLPALNAVRQVFATDMKSRLPVDPSTPLTPALRDACRDLFARNAGYLEALAK